jgi:tetratricopeptide (TPR) repeat protein
LEGAMSIEGTERRVRIFVSSPADVAPERGRVQAVAIKLNRDYEGLVRFDAVLWEEHFYKADRTFQPQIQEPEACDILVSIFWTRIGTELPGDFGLMPNGKPYPSGTAYELLTALEASRAKGLPDVYVFRKTADAVLPTADLDRRRQAQTQLDALEAFWSEWFKSDQGHFKAAFQTFGNTDEFERQIEELLRQWLHSRHLLGPRLKWPKEKGSPFPGLAPFESEHAAVFFGRDRAIDEARRRLDAAAERGTPLLLLVGPSGSGKSSLARAGLIPRLTTPGVVATVDMWRAAAMKPSEGQAGPLSSLATALFAALPELAQGDFSNASLLADNLRRGGAPAARPIVGALARAAEAAERELHSDRPLRPALVLLVDQLDELFAQTLADEERTAFAGAIKELVTTGQAWCIATLRADLYELLLKQPVLKALKEAGAGFDLGPPGSPELAEIVRAPAVAAGLVFERNAEHGALDDRLLVDANTAESLPLLQFTLRQLYERRVEADGKTLLTHAAYDALGGLKGAIAAEAERAVANLPAGTLEALPRLLRQLAEPARDGSALTLREAPQSEVAAEPKEAALAQALLEARILVARQDAAGRPALRLAHDAVLLSWPKAAEAAQASRDFYRVRAEVEDAERRWREHGKPKDRLIQRGVPLAEAEKLVADFAGELPGELIGYVNASRSQARFRQRLVAGAAVFFFLLAVAATGAGLWAYHEQRRAEATLAAATATANGLVFDLAQRFRNTVGVPASLIKDILDRARALQEQLVKSGQVTPDLKHSEDVALTEMADSLLAIGDAAGALSAAKQAQQIDADLVAADPDNVDWLHSLEVSDETVGDVQAAMGDLMGALRSYQANLSIAEKLARLHPDIRTLQRDLAVAHNRIGNVQMAQGDLADALKSYQSGLAISRQLAQSDPNDASAQRDVALSDIKVGDIEVAQGDLGAALKSLRDGLAIQQGLAKSNPGDASAQHDLSVTDQRLGDVQMEQGDLAGALASYRDGIAVFEPLARSDPGNGKWQRELSVLYERVGNVQVAQGDLGGALRSYNDCLAIRERLAKTDPGNSGWQHDLAAAVLKVGDVQFVRGDLAGALASFTNGLSLMQQLTKIDASNATWQRDTTVALNKMGAVRAARGELSTALQLYQDALAITRKLAKSDPANATWQRDLSVCLNNVGDIHIARGDLAEALKSYSDALATAQQLAKSDPSNTGSQRDLSVSYQRVGNVQALQSDFSAALSAYRASLAIMERLAKSDPGNAGWRRDLSVSYEKVGDVQAAQHDFAAALSSFQASLALRQTLTKSDPDNAGWQRDLALAYNRVGDVERGRGDLPAALSSYQDSLDIIEHLVASAPGNVGWQRDLTVTLNRVGEIQMAQKNLTGALASFQRGFAAIEAIAVSNPGNTGFQFDLAISYAELASVLRKMNEPEQALAALQKGQSVVTRLTAAAPNNPRWNQELAWFAGQIAELKSTNN